MTEPETCLPRGRLGHHFLLSTLPSDRTQGSSKKAASPHHMLQRNRGPSRSCSVARKKGNPCNPELRGFWHPEAASSRYDPSCIPFPCLPALQEPLAVFPRQGAANKQHIAASSLSELHFLHPPPKTGTHGGMTRRALKPWPFRNTLKHVRLLESRLHGDRWEELSQINGRQEF